MPTQQLAEREVSIVWKSPLWSLVGNLVKKTFNSNISTMLEKTNRAIELGVDSDQNSADAEAITDQSYKCIKLVHEARMSLTRPIRQQLDQTVQEEAQYYSQLKEATEKLKRMNTTREEKIRRKIREAEQEHARKVAEAQAKARAEEQRRINISKAQGGTGENVKPVIPDVPIAPIQTVGMRSTVKISSRVDKEKIRRAVETGARTIRGVHIFQQWTFVVTDAKDVPEAFRSTKRG